MITVEEINSILALRNPFSKANGKFDDELLFKLNRDLRDTISPMARVSNSLLYYSRLRPTSASLKLPGATAINERWWYASKPLSPRTVIDLDLQPVQSALGRFVYDASVAMRTPIELTKSAMPEEGFSAVALFMNPRKKWQLSTFTDGLGPVGHIESTSPEELIVDAIRQGYRYWSPGSVDLIVENGIRENPAPRVAAPITVEQVNRILGKTPVAQKRDGRLDMDMLFDIAEAYAVAFDRAREYAYASKRPVTVPGLSVVTQIGPTWFYGATKPLRPQRVIDYDLQPFERALAAFLFGASQEMRQPVELAQRERLAKGDWVYALFRNPVGRWQLSRFEVGEGPIGHTEGDAAEELLEQPLRQGYRRWVVGAVDRVFDAPRSNPSKPSPWVGTATLLRELRSPEQGKRVSGGGVEIERAMLVRFNPPLVGVEYAMASHLVKDGRHEVAFFPSDKQGRWPSRLLEIATVFDAKSIGAALAKLQYEPRTAIA